MDWRQKTIAQDYAGDGKRFEADWQAAIAEGRRHAVQWQDIENSVTILPKFEAQVHDLIERRLGYLPHESVVLAYEPFLRALLKSHQHGQLADEAFRVQVEDQVRLIRTADMADNLCLDYDKAIYRQYETYMPHYREAVQARLMRFLGYAPELRHSLVAELWFRRAMAKDAYHLAKNLTQLDLKVLTLIKYREVLLTRGPQAAHESALLGLKMTTAI